MWRAYKNFRPFHEPEAWLLFKFAAWAEAVGWTLLIIGIWLRDYVVHANWPVAVAGQIHGTFFLAYIGAALVTAPSLGWSLPRTILAGACSVPPFGSLVYELVSARLRRQKHIKHWYYAVTFSAILSA